MQNNVVYQQQDRSWMINVVFYLMLAGFVLVIFLYGIFYFKVSIVTRATAVIEEKISAYGTEEQKQHEQQVFDYKKKIDDFVVLLGAHKMSSNIFNFLEAKTLPNIVFSDFTMSETRNEIRLLGEADTMATLSQQFTILESATDYIKNISVLNSQIAPSGRIAFVFNISLDPGIFAYGAINANP